MALDMHVEGQAVFGFGAVDAAGPWRGVFSAPRLILRADRLEDVAALVRQGDAAARDGHWVVLVVGYEAAPACDAALRVQPAGHDATPLAWAAVYDAPLPACQSPFPVQAELTDEVPIQWIPHLDAAEFAARIDALLGHIAAGDTYQVNFTFPQRASLPVASAWSWYASACQRARAPYAAWIDVGTHVVMSLSPELFVERRGGRLVTRPMKGTQARGRWSDEDESAREALRTSDKARAENIMIVDLLRNDLGRVAKTGSVRVTDLCGIEGYPSVWQMTSTIEATVAPDRPLWDLFEALFPCGSVTGAPKVRTMELIADHEVSPRGVYTGAIGLLQPGGDGVFSVPIRTVVLDKATGVATLGVGAGITADSVAAEEYAECLLKGRFASGETVPSTSGLFETLRLESGVYALRARHLVRLRQSAARWSLPCDPGQLEAALDAVAASHGEGCWRVRLDLSPTGDVTARADPHVDDMDAPWRVALSHAPVSRHDATLFHKMRDRSRYERAHATHPTLDDVILWNREGEVTESCLANLVVELDGARWTPPLDCGLLPGTFRAQLLETGEIRERVLTRGDLRRATRVWLVNSVRGWIEAEVVEG